MTPRRTLLLIALFVTITFGSFVLYIVRSVSNGPETSFVAPPFTGAAA